MFADIHEYDDIISLPRPVSSRHAPMPPDKRAAQFAPFAALTGYEDIVRETARLTEEAPQLDDDEKERINSALSFLSVLLAAGETPEIEVVFFRRDERKSGGSIVCIGGRLRRVDPDERTLLLDGFGAVAIDGIVDVRGELLAPLDAPEWA